MKFFKKYSSISGLGKNCEVLNHKCVVQEKLHGSNLRFSYNEVHGIVIGSRNNVVFKDGQMNNAHYNSVHILLSMPKMWEKIKEKYVNYTFYGEVYGFGVQKGIEYKDHKDIAVFDIRDPDGNYLDWDDVVSICNEVGVETVPEIMRGIVTLEELNKIIDQVTPTGAKNGFDKPDNIQEGFVIKALKMQRDRRGNWMMAKYKSKKWVEQVRTKKEKKLTEEEMTLQNEADEFANRIVTMGRTATIIDHIARDSGNPEMKISRTGEFLREFIKDVQKEFGELYVRLDNKEANVYNKIITQKACQAWKKWLMENE